MSVSDGRETLYDHLEAVRWLILRSLLYLLVCTVAAWAFRNQLFTLLQYPALEGAARAGLEDFAFRIFTPTGGIMLMMHASLVTGAVVSSPLWLFEIVRFVAPALQHHERRAALLLIPLAVFLFCLGVVFCYVTSPVAFAFLFDFNRSLGVTPEVTLADYLHFFMRLTVVFGLIFEMPLVLMFLTYFGIVSANLLSRGWRVAVVIILITAALVTPADPFSMVLMAAPMIILYVCSVTLSRFVEKRSPHRFHDDPVEIETSEEPAIVSSEVAEGEYFEANEAVEQWSEAEPAKEDQPTPDENGRRE